MVADRTDRQLQLHDRSGEIQQRERAGGVERSAAGQVLPAPVGAQLEPGARLQIVVLEVDPAGGVNTDFFAVFSDRIAVPPKEKGQPFARLALFVFSDS